MVKLGNAQLGRGLHCLAFRSELMLTHLSSTLQSSIPTSTRRAAIWTVEAQAKTHLSLIGGYIAHKYGMEATDDVKTIREAQWRTLYGEINQKIEHKKLYRAITNEIVSMPGSTVWLRSGNIAPREEAALCALQDRNLFMGAGGT
ncbi:hypothetical protein PAPHI01_0571, partial [Pancytospora philotis]